MMSALALSVRYGFLTFALGITQGVPRPQTKGRAAGSIWIPESAGSGQATDLHASDQAENQDLRTGGKTLPRGRDAPDQGSNKAQMGLLHPCNKP